MYPEYSIYAHETRAITLRTLKEKKMAELNEHPDAPKSKTLYYISLPTVESHQGHPTGEGVAGFTQRINEKVAQKIAEIVSQGITDIHQVRTLLRQGDICKGNLPDPNDRGYFPTNTD